MKHISKRGGIKSLTKWRDRDGNKKDGRITVIWAADIRPWIRPVRD